MSVHITPNQLIQLIIPGITAVFAFGFACAWFYDRRLRYLRLLAASFVAFALGSAVQICHLPDEWRLNALIRNVLCVEHSTVGGRCDAQGRASLATGDACVDVRAGAGRHVLLLLRDAEPAGAYLHSEFQRRAVDVVYRDPFQETLQWPHRQPRSPLGAADLRRQFFIRTSLTTIQPLPHSTAPFARTIFWVLLQLSLALMGAVLGLVLLAAAMSDVIDRLTLERDLDSLTETLNRRAFERVAGRRVADRRSYPLTLIAFDIDNFKSINDRYGHAAGDAVLRQFAAILRAAVREKDVVARIGGEEFVLLLPGADDKFAYEIAERLRTVLESSRFDEIEATLRVTTSAGIARHRPAEDVGALLARADHLLYAAKRAGRNRVVGESPGQTRDAPERDMV